jgi:hypothetical protein
MTHSTPPAAADAADSVAGSADNVVNEIRRIQPKNVTVAKPAEGLCAVRRCTVQYSVVPCSAVQYSTVQYSTVQYSTVQCSAVQYSAVQYSTV